LYSIRNTSCAIKDALQLLPCSPPDTHTHTHTRTRAHTHTHTHTHTRIPSSSLFSIPVIVLSACNCRDTNLDSLHVCLHPVSCSYSVIKACCQWKEQDRVTLAEVSRKLQSGEKSAN